jgi:hypothetical protein
MCLKKIYPGPWVGALNGPQAHDILISKISPLFQITSGGNDGPVKQKAIKGSMSERSDHPLKR